MCSRLANFTSQFNVRSTESPEHGKENFEDLDFWPSVGIYCLANSFLHNGTGMWKEFFLIVMSTMKYLPEIRPKHQLREKYSV